MGRILRWGLLQLCQSLVNGLYSPVPSNSTNDIKCDSNKTQSLKRNLDAQDGQIHLKRQKTNINNIKSHTTKNISDSDEQNIRTELVKNTKRHDFQVQEKTKPISVTLQKITQISN